MATTTTNLGLPRPEASDNVTLANQQALIDAIDTGAETPAGAQTKADAVQTNLNTHTAATTGVHGATSAATAGKIAIRDASGRMKVAAPSASDDVARKDTVDNAVATSLPLVGGTLTGDVVIQKAGATATVNATSGNPAYEIKLVGVRRGYLFHNASDGTLELRKYASDGTTIEQRINLSTGGITLSGMNLFRRDTSPEGSQVGSIGDICTVWATAAAGIWVKTTGIGTNTGWGKVTTA